MRAAPTRFGRGVGGGPRRFRARVIALQKKDKDAARKRANVSLFHSSPIRSLSKMSAPVQTQRGVSPTTSASRISPLAQSAADQHSANIARTMAGGCARVIALQKKAYAPVGIELENGGEPGVLVARVNDRSVLAGLVNRGDRIVKINGALIIEAKVAAVILGIHLINVISVI